MKEQQVTQSGSTVSWRSQAVQSADAVRQYWQTIQSGINQRGAVRTQLYMKTHHAWAVSGNTSPATLQW